LKLFKKQFDHNEDKIIRGDRYRKVEDHKLSQIREISKVKSEGGRVKPGRATSSSPRTVKPSPPHQDGEASASSPRRQSFRLLTTNGEAFAYSPRTAKPPPLLVELSPPLANRSDLGVHCKAMA